MTGAIVGLTIAYVALAVLLLNLSFHSRWPLWIKGSSIVLAMLLYFVTFLSLQRFAGWPANTDMPAEFVVLSVHVEEPDETIGIQGGIYLWTLARGVEYVDTLPRAFYLPYSRYLHGEANKAAKRINRGIVQMGNFETVRTGPGAAPQTMLFEEDTRRLVIRDFPSPELPDK